MSLLASPSLTSRTTSRSVGVSEAQPLAGRLRSPRRPSEGDPFVGGQRGALGPCAFKVLLAQRIAKCSHRELDSGVENLESDEAAALSDAVCGAIQPRRFTVTAGECGKALQSVGSGAVCPSADGGCERVVRVAAGLFRLTLRDRDTRPRRQRQRQVKVTRRRDGLIGQAPGHDEIPARQRGLGRVSNPDRRHLGLDTEMGPARRDRIIRRDDVARSEGRDSQPHMGQAREEPAEFRSGLDGRVA